MRLSSRTKSISYLKAPAAEIVHTVADTQELLIMTQNGEARVVTQDVDSYERLHEAFRISRASE